MSNNSAQFRKSNKRNKEKFMSHAFLCCFFADMLISHSFAGQLSLLLIFKTSTYCLVAISCIQYRINSEWTSRSNLKFLAPCEWECVGVFQRIKEKKRKDKQKEDQRKILYNHKTTFLNHLNLGIQLI